MHQSVMSEEVTNALAIVREGVYIDATFGRGGHSAAILAALGPAGRLVVIDRDPQAIAYARETLGGDARVTICHAGFGDLAEVAREAGVVNGVNGILLDLGVSSPQLDQGERGFSFRHDGPLDMRMDTTRGESAAQWLARAKEDEIVAVLRDYGEERYARRIARAIVATRDEQPLQRTRQLAQLIEEAVPSRERGKDPATRSFQAIRIYVNAELDQLSRCLDAVRSVLAIGGRLAVISFHSLEDRIVKRFIRDAERGERLPLGVPVRAADEPGGWLKRIGKAQQPSEQEVQRNPRARSAVLRVAQRVA